MPRSRAAVAALIAGAVVASAGLVQAFVHDTGSKNACSAMRTPVYEQVNPQDQSSLLASSVAEANASAAQGYTQKMGALFKASTDADDGLLAVHRLHRQANNDYLWTTDGEEIAAAQTRQGFADQGTSFYASAVNATCLVPVYGYLFRGQHRLAVTASDRQQLQAVGWKSQGIKFYAAPGIVGEDAAPAPASVAAKTKFSFVVMPDTQLEVTTARDPRFLDRSLWLVENRAELNLQFVTHTGDVVDADGAGHPQYKRAQAGLKPLYAAGIPYTLAVGNHDTEAECADGQTCGGAKEKHIRDTTTFNDYFKAQAFGAVKGEYEAGKVDNAYAIYQAGGVQWLVLTLELSARPDVVAWANQVVEKHPHANVIVATHRYLGANGEILKDDGGYGPTSPQYLFTHLISQHTNIKLVFSGHVGGTAQRVDTGVHGNKIYSFLAAIHDPTYNPMRIVQVDTAKNTLAMSMYVPDTDTTWPTSRRTFSNMAWVH